MASVQPIRQDAQVVSLNDGNQFFGELGFDILEKILALLDTNSLMNLSASSKFMASYIPPVAYQCEILSINRLQHRYLSPTSDFKELTSTKLREAEKDFYYKPIWDQSKLLFSLRRSSIIFSSFKKILIYQKLNTTAFTSIKYSIDLPRSLKETFLDASHIQRIRAEVRAELGSQSNTANPYRAERAEREILQLYVKHNSDKAFELAKAIGNLYYRNTTLAKLVSHSLHKDDLTSACQHIINITFFAIRYPLERDLIQKLSSSERHEELLQLISNLPINSRVAREHKAYHCLSIVDKLCSNRSLNIAQAYLETTKDKRLLDKIHAKLSTAYLELNELNTAHSFLVQIRCKVLKHKLAVQGLKKSFKQNKAWEVMSFYSALEFNQQELIKPQIQRKFPEEAELYFATS